MGNKTIQKSARSKIIESIQEISDCRGRYLGFSASDVLSPARLSDHLNTLKDVNGKNGNLKLMGAEEYGLPMNGVGWHFLADCLVLPYYSAYTEEDYGIGVRILKNLPESLLLKIARSCDETHPSGRACVLDREKSGLENYLKVAPVYRAPQGNLRFRCRERFGFPYYPEHKVFSKHPIVQEILGKASVAVAERVALGNCDAYLESPIPWHISSSLGFKKSNVLLCSVFVGPLGLINSWRESPTVSGEGWTRLVTR